MWWRGRTTPVDPGDSPSSVDGALPGPTSAGRVVHEVLEDAVVSRVGQRIVGAASLDLAGDEATLRMLDALGLRGLIRLRDGLLHVRVPLGGVRPLRPGPGAETASALASQQGPDHSRAGRPRAV